MCTGMRVTPSLWICMVDECACTCVCVRARVCLCMLCRQPHGRRAWVTPFSPIFILHLHLSILLTIHMICWQLLQRAARPRQLGPVRVQSNWLSTTTTSLSRPLSLSLYQFLALACSNLVAIPPCPPRDLHVPWLLQIRYPVAAPRVAALGPVGHGSAGY